MGKSPEKVSDRSVHVGGNANHNVIVTGDQNVTNVQYRQITLPPPESVDICSEFAALRTLLTNLDSPDQRKIDNALADAEDELRREVPDRNEIGKALDRALDYARKAGDFVGLVEKLQPPMTKAVAWLGENWHKILGVVGLAA
jgi:hypothetical protein